MNRGWGGCVLFLFREDSGSIAQKLANRWNYFNSFAEVNVALFWSRYDGINGMVSQGPSKQNSIPANRYIAFTDSLYQIDSVVFQCCISVCFVLFWGLQW